MGIRTEEYLPYLNLTMQNNKGQDEAYDQTIRDTQNTIAQYTNRLRDIRNGTAKQNGLSEPELMTQLNAEFDKLRKTRTERSEQYSAWFDQLKETRRERSKQIRERSDAVEQELVALDKKDQAQRQPSALKQPDQSAAEICDRLLDLLQDIQPTDGTDDKEGDNDDPSLIDGDRIRVVQGQPVDGVDTSVLLVPMSALELFWHIDVVVPACLSEIDDTIQEIKKRKTAA